jgi:hypothetical protein
MRQHSVQSTHAHTATLNHTYGRLSHGQLLELLRERIDLGLSRLSLNADDYTLAPGAQRAPRHAAP